MKQPLIIRFVIILLLTSFTALYFYIDRNQRQLQSTQIEDVSILRGNKDQAKITLTFNMSWGNEKINDILDVLRAENVRATFFISGEWLERHPHIVDKLKDDKHEIAMLGYRYTNYANDDEEEMKRDIAYAYDVFNKYDLKPTYIRAPNGIFSEAMKAYVKQYGLIPVHYRLQTNDLRAKSAQSLADQTIKQVENGDILLFHASDIATFTADGLQILIPQLMEKQFRIVTLTELLNEIDINERELD